MNLALPKRSLFLQKEIEIGIQLIIRTDSEVLKIILAIFALTYAIIQDVKPAMIFLYDLGQAVNYTVKMVQIVSISLLYGFS